MSRISGNIDRHQPVTLEATKRMAHTAQGYNARERGLRAELHRRGLRFRLHRSVVEGPADLWTSFCGQPHSRFRRWMLVARMPVLQS